MRAPSEPEIPQALRVMLTHMILLLSILAPVLAPLTQTQDDIWPQFLGPRGTAVVDSKPTCTGVVTDMNEDTQTVEIDLTIANEAAETRVMGTAVVKF